MTFKSKIFGLLAGAALALGLAAGTLATDATVTLQNNSDPSAGCFPFISGGKFDLGTWEWNGYGYDHVLGTGNGGSLQLLLSQDVSADTITCYLNASGGPLTQIKDANGNTITSGSTINLAIMVNGSGNQATVPTPWNGFVGTIAVSMANLGTQSAGEYTGTVELTANMSS